ncbi:hypothetical protein CBOM_08090 [Ceraceosorus bombacis]|uniref:Uncharacterized protein n=1 Tax=Ceraceosorus bombacis TaxID=401625 RepID=A0A0P1BKL3_9BASI|nr:hypothetical protein CBOM_08090 [Ceraceosorus bombacis]
MTPQSNPGNLSSSHKCNIPKNAPRNIMSPACSPLYFCLVPITTHLSVQDEKETKACDARE